MSALLLEFLAPPDQRNAEGATPLMFACASGKINCARLLMAAGADIGAADNEDRCAIVKAAAQGHLECVEYLAACDWHKEEEDGAKKGAIGLAEAAQQALVAAAQNGRFQASYDKLR